MTMKHVTWIKLREQVVTDDAAVIGVTTRNFANMNSGTGNAVKIGERLEDIIITFLGKLTDQTASFTWRLYGYRKDNGMGEMIAYGTGNLGDVAATVHPITGVAATDLFYADYLTITAQYNPTLVSIVDIAGASGEVAKIFFTNPGFEYLLMELTDCDAGTGNETDQLEAIYTGLARR